MTFWFCMEREFAPLAPAVLSAELLSDFPQDVSMTDITAAAVIVTRAFLVEKTFMVIPPTLFLIIIAQYLQQIRNRSAVFRIVKTTNFSIQVC